MSTPPNNTTPEPRRAEYASREGEIVIRPHEYDGIQEYDQMLPNWWLAIFFATLLFFPLLWIGYYQLGFMKSDEEKINSQMALIEKAKSKALDEMLAKLDDNALINQWAKDPAAVANGKETYLANCSACHAQDLSAKMVLAGGQSIPLPGLPLNDGQWKYGASALRQFQLINGGTPADNPGHNGVRMEAWGQKMPPLKIVEVVAYLISENTKDFVVSTGDAPANP